MAAHGEPLQQPQDRHADHRAERVLAAEDQRRTGDQVLQLGEGHDRAGEGIAPITVPSPISTRLWVLMCPGEPMPKASGETNVAAATTTAASPTSGWNAATSCGSAVIWMRNATSVPIAPPITSPPMISQGETTPGVAIVTPIAITAPTMLEQVALAVS